jgi:hypothetical protein
VDAAALATAARAVAVELRASVFDAASKKQKAGGGTGFSLSFITNADRPSPTICVVRPFAAKFLGDPRVVVAATPEELNGDLGGLLRWRTLRDVLTLAEMTAIRGQWVPVEVLAKLQGFPPNPCSVQYEPRPSARHFAAPSSASPWVRVGQRKRAAAAGSRKPTMMTRRRIWGAP